MEVIEPSVKSLPDFDTMVGAVYEHGLYHVAKFISKNGGKLDDAKDVFHDALIMLYDQQRKGTTIEDELAYLYGIARNLWFKRMNTKMRDELIDGVSLAMEDASAPDEQKVLVLLKKGGQRCLELLSSFYMESLSIPKIKARFGFSSEHSASVQKYKCIEKIRETLKATSLRYEDFFK